LDRPLCSRGPALLERCPDLGQTPLRSYGSLADNSAQANKCDVVTGKKFDATRALLSVPSGRGHHTRFQRCWRYGAALDVWNWSLISEGPCYSRRSGRRDDVAVVPADAKSIATSPAWRNPPLPPQPRFVSPSLADADPRSSCRVPIFRDGFFRDAPVAVL